MKEKRALAHWMGTIALLAMAIGAPALGATVDFAATGGVLVPGDVEQTLNPDADQASPWLRTEAPSSAAVETASAQTPLQAIAQTEQTLIPLPAPAWTGLAGLGTLAACRARKTLLRMLK